MPKTTWTQADLSNLIRQVAHEGKVLSAIRIKGKTKAAINQKRRRLRDAGLLNDKPTKHHRPWTICELNELRKLTKLGLSARSIAKAKLIHDRSKYAISKMMTRYNLGDPAMKEQAKNAKRLSEDEKTRLKQLLLNKGRRMSSKQVAVLFELSPKTVNSWRRRLGVALTWHKARQQAEAHSRKVTMRAK